MKPPSFVHRAALLAVALLQLGATGGAAWADARLDAGGPHGPVHLESRSSGTCLPVHPTDCILHRFLTTMGRAGRPLAAPAGLEPSRTDASTDARRTRSDPSGRLPDIRGPPSLS